MHAKLLYVTALYLPPSSVSDSAFLRSSIATLKFSKKSYIMRIVDWLKIQLTFLQKTHGKDVANDGSLVAGLND